MIQQQIPLPAVITRRLRGFLSGMKFAYAGFYPGRGRGWLGIILMVVVLVVAACGGGTKQPIGTGESVTITFAAWDYERQIYAPLAEQFMREHAGVSVLLVPLEDLMNYQDSSDASTTAMVRRVVSGTDTAQAINTQPEILKSNLLLDLKPFLDSDPNVPASDFYPSALEQYMIDGKLKVLPRTLSLRVLAYNKDLFTAANLPLPTADWTWTDLLANASQLAVKQGETVNTYGFFDTSGGFLTFLGMLEKKDIDLLNMSAKDIRLDQEEIVSTVEQLRDYFDQGVLLAPSWSYEEGADPPPDPSQLAIESRIAIWDSEMTLYDYGDGKDEQGPKKRTFSFAVGKVPYPMLQSNMMMGGGGGYMISSGTRHPELAWQWIEFLSRNAPELQANASPSYHPPSNFPARKSVAEAMGYWNDLDEETRLAYQTALDQKIPGLNRSPDEVLFGALSQALMPIFSGQGSEADIPQLLMEAQQQLEEQIATMQLTPTPPPDDSPVVVATPWPQVAPEGSTSVNFISLLGSDPTLMRQRLRTFQERHPDMFIENKNMPNSMEPLTVKDLADTYDCFLQNNPVTDPSDAQALLDLQPLFDADATFSQDDYPPALLDALRNDGHLVGIPFGFMMRTLNVNKTAFDTAGIAPPSAQWTPDDFQAAALALTSGEGETKRYGYVPLGGHPIEDMRFFIRQFGSDLLIGGSENPRPNFDDPKVIEAIRWYLDLAKVHQVMPPITFSYKPDSPGEEANSYELVQRGMAGMWFDYGYGMFAYPESMPPDVPPFEVRVTPLPVGRAGIRGNDISFSGIFHISAKTEHPQVCWEWFKQLADDASLVEWAIPARRSLLDSEAYLSQAQPRAAEVAQIYAEVLQTPGVISSVGSASQEYVEMYWFFDALMNTIQHDTDLEAGLVDAQQKTNAFLDCVANGGEQLACALQADPNYEGYMNEKPMGRVSH